MKNLFSSLDDSFQIAPLSASHEGVVRSPLGPMAVHFRDGKVCRLSFLEDQERAAGRYNDHPLIVRVGRQLEEYFAGDRFLFDLPLAVAGTRFQRQVWCALRDIPYGTTCSYKEIARRVGVPMGSRAVGQANNRNPLAIIIPCHRVIAQNGSLGGYAGGIWRKEYMLALEKKASKSHD